VQAVSCQRCSSIRWPPWDAAELKLCNERAGELAADPIRAALCRGQAMAYEEAAEHIDDALSIATGRWG